MQPVELALDAALVVMQNGGSTVAADRTFCNVLKGLDTGGVNAVWRLDFVALSTEPGAERSAVVRPIGRTGVNLRRASEAMVLAERLAAEGGTPSEVAAGLERIKALAVPYSRELMVAAAACAAGVFARLAGADWGGMGIVVVAAAIGQCVRSQLQARQVAVARVMLICGVLSALIAGVGLRMGYSEVAPATLVASVAYMVPGLPLINGFIDLSSHKYLLVGVERILMAGFLFLVLAVAIAFADALLL